MCNPNSSSNSTEAVITLKPNLTRHDARLLAPHATDHVGVHIPRYGTPARELISDDWSWLEAMVLAGYVPHFEGIELAIRGTHSWWLREMRYAEAKGADGDALNWVDGVELYQRLISLLESLAFELSDERTRLLAKPPRHG